MGPTWGPSGADRTQMGPMLAPWTLLSRIHTFALCCNLSWLCYHILQDYFTAAMEIQRVLITQPWRICRNELHKSVVNHITVIKQSKSESGVHFRGHEGRLSIVFKCMVCFYVSRNIDVFIKQVFLCRFKYLSEWFIDISTRCDPVMLYGSGTLSTIGSVNALSPE